jgi:thiol:disulfide interchange protein
MNALFRILGLISAILAVILSVLPLSNMTFIPALAALVFGLIAFMLARQQQEPRKSIQLIFILTILALSLATYKFIFNESEVGNTEELKQTEEKSQEEAIEELEELDIDDIDLE